MRHRQAMTAIEVLAATALASLMFVSVMGVLAGMGRHYRVLASQRTVPGWHRQFAVQMAWDLRNARTFTRTPTGLVLEGFGGRDFATGAATGRPTLVEYSVVPLDSQSVLLRRETHTDESTNENTQVELVAFGIDRIIIGVDGAVGVDSSRTGRSPMQQNRPQPVPEQMLVGLVGSALSALVFERQFVIR